VAEHCDVCPLCTEVGLQETETEVTVGADEDELKSLTRPQADWKTEVINTKTNIAKGRRKEMRLG